MTASHTWSNQVLNSFAYHRQDNTLSASSMLYRMPDATARTIRCCDLSQTTYHITYDSERGGAQTATAIPKRIIAAAKHFHEAIDVFSTSTAEFNSLLGNEFVVETFWQKVALYQLVQQVRQSTLSACSSKTTSAVNWWSPTIKPKQNTNASFEAYLKRITGEEFERNKQGNSVNLYCKLQSTKAAKALLQQLNRIGISGSDVYTTNDRVTIKNIKQFREQLIAAVKTKAPRV